MDVWIVFWQCYRSLAVLINGCCGGAKEVWQCQSLLIDGWMAFYQCHGNLMVPMAFVAAP